MAGSGRPTRGLRPCRRAAPARQADRRVGRRGLCRQGPCASQAAPVQGPGGHRAAVGLRHSRSRVLSARPPPGKLSRQMVLGLGPVGAHTRGSTARPGPATGTPGPAPPWAFMGHLCRQNWPELQEGKRGLRFRPRQSRSSLLSPGVRLLPRRHPAASQISSETPNRRQSSIRPQALLPGPLPSRAVLCSPRERSKCTCPGPLGQHLHPELGQEPSGPDPGPGMETSVGDWPVKARAEKALASPGFLCFSLQAGMVFMEDPRASTDPSPAASMSRVAAWPLPVSGHPCFPPRLSASQCGCWEVPEARGRGEGSSLARPPGEGILPRQPSGGCGCRPSSLLAATREAGG